MDGALGPTYTVPSTLREDWLSLEQEWMSPMSQRAGVFCVEGRRLWEATPLFFQSRVGEAHPGDGQAWGPNLALAQGRHLS